MIKGLCQSITAHAIVLAENDIIPINKRKNIYRVEEIIKVCLQKNTN